MDRTGANFLSVVEQIRERLGHNAIAMQLPIGAEDNFTGIIDLVNNVAHMFTDDMGTYDEEPIPADYAELAAEYREKLVEAAAETDEELMMKYLEGEELTVEEIKGAVRKATCEVKMIPVFCGSAFKNKGYRCCWTQSLIIAQLQPIFLLSKGLWKTAKKQNVMQATANHSALWLSKL